MVAERFVLEELIGSGGMGMSIARSTAPPACASPSNRSADGELYIAMEWLEGEDHGRRGLAVVHARGVVHRDLEPANIFLIGGDVQSVKILDLGIARVSGGALTSAGHTLGTRSGQAPRRHRITAGRSRWMKLSFPHSHTPWNRSAAPRRQAVGSSPISGAPLPPGRESTPSTSTV